MEPWRGALGATASTTVIAPQLAFVVNIPKFTLAAWNGSLSEQAKFKQHIATAITSGRVLVLIDPAATALRGINVPTYIRFLEDGMDPSNANEFFFNLLEHPEDVLPPVEYGLVNATLAQFSLVQADPNVYTAPYQQKKPNTAAIIGGVVGGVLGTAALVGVAVVLSRTGTGAHMLGSLPGAITRIPGSLHLPAMMRLPVGWQRAEFGESPQATSKAPAGAVAFVSTSVASKSRGLGNHLVHGKNFVGFMQHSLVRQGASQVPRHRAVAVKVFGGGQTALLVAGAGVLEVLLSSLSLKTWRAQQPVAKLFTALEAGVAGLLTYEAYKGLQRGVARIPHAGLLLLSALMTLFLVYNLAAGGNPPPKEKPAAVIE
ncbi:hypothetical protein N2152v2_002243 [Parachlorella kessleri]